MDRYSDKELGEYEKKQAQVKADVEAYIAAGGKIHVIETEPCDTIVTRVGEIYEQRF